MELTGNLRLIWASKRWLALFAVVAAVVVYAISSSKSDEYESSALGQIVTTSQAAGEILNEEQLLSLSNLYDELAKTRSVFEVAHEDPAIKGREEAIRREHRSPARSADRRDELLRDHRQPG